MAKKSDDAFVLTEQNYYTDEANEHYLSFHTFLEYVSINGIRGCEARAEAIRHGEWHKNPPSKAMLVGSYVDSWMDGEEALEQFRNEHPEIFLKDGVTLKAEYRQAEIMIDRMQKDDYFMQTISGEHQVIMTADWEGFTWRCKIDSYIEDKAIVDLKTSSDLHKMWRVGEKGYLTVPEYWCYTHQLALYQKIVEINTGKQLPCYLSFVTKEDCPELVVVNVDQETLDRCLNEIKEHLDEVRLVRNGEVIPVRCGVCDYCKTTHKITKPIGIWDLVGED